MTDNQQLNDLRDEASAYLQQHKSNPVKWFPYGAKALQKAKDEDKPIFLSIGYSTCHWCHVMASESFENPIVADFLNENFISIKVDKEELPDLDSYFQLACQLFTGRGGWPLNVFLTPKFDPFFIATYMPPAKRDKQPSFMEVITELSKSFKEDRENINKNSIELTNAIAQKPVAENKVEFEGHFPSAAAIIDALKNYQDDVNGGYGDDPKFPHYSFFEWAVEHILEGMVPQELGKHTILSIERMLMGGIFDHAKGGIHRYSTDKNWNVPHFEKMLYDQAGLLKLLAKTSLLYPAPIVYDSIAQTLDYLKSEMQSEEGYFFSAQDADSEGVEGLYFTFTKEEFDAAIEEFGSEVLKNKEKVTEWFCIKEDGLNVIQLNPELKEIIYEPEAWNLVRGTKKALVNARKNRIPPQTDNKGVASWNFQLLSSLIDVIQYVKIESIQQKASELLNSSTEAITNRFLVTDSQGKTRIHTSTTRHGHAPQFEDYVMFAEFSFRCFEYSGNEKFKANALNTISFIFKAFFKDGAFYTRSIEHNESEEYTNIHTPIFDQSYKSALGTLIVLLRKWSLEQKDFVNYLEEMKSTIETLTHLSLQNPLGFGESLRALVYPPQAYRLIEVPKSWYKDGSFFEFFPNFSIRFAITSHDRDDNSWQICNLKECEISGKSLAEFKDVFKPKPKAEDAK